MRRGCGWRCGSEVSGISVPAGVSRRAVRQVSGGVTSPLERPATPCPPGHRARRGLRPRSHRRAGGTAHGQRGRDREPHQDDLGERAGDTRRVDSDWDTIGEFAQTFNGYGYWGSFERCAEVALARPSATLTELRTCLFFAQRTWHHFGDYPVGKLRTTRGASSKASGPTCALGRLRRRQTEGVDGGRPVPLPRRGSLHAAVVGRTAH